MKKSYLKKLLIGMYDDTSNVLGELNNPEHIDANYRDELEMRVENIRFELRAIKRELELKRGIR